MSTLVSGAIWLYIKNFYDPVCSQFSAYGMKLNAIMINLSKSASAKYSNTTNKTLGSGVGYKTAPFFNTGQQDKDQYGDLVVESVSKNYLVCNLKPFASDDTLFDKLKAEVRKISPSVKKVEKLRLSPPTQVKPKQQVSLFVQSFRSQAKTKTRLRKCKTMIESNLYDDHELLIEDYKQDLTLEKQKKKLTINSLNELLQTQYPDKIEPNKGPTKRPTLFKFKKQHINVVTQYQENNKNNIGVTNKNHKGVLDVNKQDYGIYSRSTNRTFYYENKPKFDYFNDEANLFQKQRAMNLQKTFYRKYLSSYTHRKKMLNGCNASSIF